MGHHFYRGIKKEGYDHEGYRRYRGLSPALKIAGLVAALIVLVIVVIVGLLVIRLLLDIVAPNTQTVQSIRDWLSSAIKSINPIQLLLGN